MQCFMSISSATSAPLLQAYLCVCVRTRSHEADVVGEIFSVSTRYGLM